MKTVVLSGLAATAIALSAHAAAPDRAARDVKTVAALDVAYQAAVKANDAATMARILHPDFVLVVGSGDVATRADLLRAARDKRIAWEIQDEVPGSQVVRLFGDTAVVTAKLHLKYPRDGQTVDRTLWFSDTYIRTPQGWRYAFGQSSLALPAGR